MCQFRHIIQVLSGMLYCLLSFTCVLRALATSSQNCYIINRGNKMAVKVKPVQPTEIKDKKIALQVIEEIRKPIPIAVYKRHQKLAKVVNEMIRK